MYYSKYMDRLRIYTDGGCRGNQSRTNTGGWGAVLEYRGHTKELKGGARNTTNNLMEMTALLEAFRALKKENQTIEVFSDSSYLTDCFRKKWYMKWQRNGWMTSKKAPVEHREIWEELLGYLDIHRISFYRVRGHANLNKAEEMKRLYAEFKKWNGNSCSYDDFLHISAMNNKCDALANQAMDELRRG